MKNSNVILFQTHIITKDILHEFQKIFTATEGYADTYLLYDDKGMTVPNEVEKLKYFSFNKKTISQLNYPMVIDEKIVSQFPNIKAIHHVQNQLGLINFYLENQHYKFYWFIEYDVRYSGNWEEFFKCFDDKNKSDLLTAQIRFYNEEPEWNLWYLNHPVYSIDESKRIASFNTIMRLSNEALKFLHDSLSDGWAGHLEVLIPTLLHKKPFILEDFGGVGKFCRQENINKHYIGSDYSKSLIDVGTMRYRMHMFYVGFYKNKLYHPVKPIKDRIRYLLKKLKKKIANILNYFTTSAPST